jgi:hypothetical protein
MRKACPAAAQANRNPKPNGRPEFFSAIHFSVIKIFMNSFPREFFFREPDFFAFLH